MKKLFFLLPIFISFLIIYVFRAHIGNAFESAYYYSPCDTPITFSIGTIDSGFNTTQEELLKDAIAAANIWNLTLGKTILKYDPKSEFKINLVYDTRQELTTKIKNLKNELEEKQNEIDPKIEDYKKRQLAFEIEVKKLNNDISYWNSQGGAPKDEYEELLKRQENLKMQAQTLNDEAKLLGQQTTEYNANARILNSTIDDYKGVLVIKPEEGLYVQEGSFRSISIFIDVGHEEFLHTLAHEFGHALGLEHNADKNSIMYPQTSRVLVPTVSEIEELKLICEEKPLHQVVSTKLKDVIEKLRVRFASQKIS